MSDEIDRNEAGRRLGALVGAFLICVLSVTGFDLASSLLEFVLLITGGTTALFLTREGIDQLWRRR